MKHIEERLRRAVSATTPDVLQSVLADCGKGTVIVMKKNRNTWAKRVAGLAAVLALVIAGVGGFGIYRANYAVASTVSFDINPSIEIRLNEKEKVLAVEAKNADAEIVLGDMEFEGSSLEITVNALVGSMLRNGYISEIENSILISVESEDPQQGAQLQEKLSADVAALLHTDTFDGAVLSQTVAADSELQQQADAYGITTGKAQLIRDVMAQNANRTFEELAPLTINELNLLAAEQPEHATVSGRASDKAYIGREAAEQAVLAEINASAEQVTRWDTDLDFEDGRMVYEVEFRLKDSRGENEAVVDAVTGEILYARSEPEYVPEQPVQQSAVQPAEQTASEYITEEEAEQIAFAHAGVEDARVQKTELDRDDGRVVYEIEFRKGLREYEYEIDAVTGEVLKSDAEFGD